MELKERTTKISQYSVDDERKAKKRHHHPESKEDKLRRQKKRGRIIVRNISYKSNEDTLRKHFQQWGTVEEVSLLKRPDGKLVGCAFVQYEKINEATKAILKGNGKEMLGRPIFIDWAVGKDEYKSKKQQNNEPKGKKPKIEKEEESTVKEESHDDEEENENDHEADSSTEEDDIEQHKNDHEEDEDSRGQFEDDDENDSESDNDDEDGDEHKSDNDHLDEDDKKNLKDKLDIDRVKKEKHISNDVIEGRTVFIKNIPFDIEDDELRKLCRKFGPIKYAIINREPISGHSKGTAFVQFRTKESADLCLQAGPEFVVGDQELQPFPALSKEEIKNQRDSKDNDEKGKDSRNLYLAREGLIMAGSKAAEGVSTSDIKKRHELERVKAQVLKNLNRFVSRNRLSIHNLPLSYDNEKLKEMVIRHTGLRPHECRVMRENKITAENPQGKSKGFGFMSFKTHQNALLALRKLNNHPNVFKPNHRPIVAFSIEDRAVHKIKEKRKQKSKINNPTYQEKLAKRKELRKQKSKVILRQKQPQTEDKAKLKKHIKKLEETRATQLRSTADAKAKNIQKVSDFIGTEAEAGTSIRMRSNKKIAEQAREHKKRLKANKRSEKQSRIKQMHLAERRENARPKQGRKKERDDLANLVEKYKNIIGGGSGINNSNSNKGKTKSTAFKRTKWYTE